MKLNEIDKEILEILNEATEKRSGMYEGKADLFIIISSKGKYTRGQFDYSIKKLKEEGLIKSLAARGVYKITDKGIQILKIGFEHKPVEKYFKGDSKTNKKPEERLLVTERDGWKITNRIGEQDDLDGKFNREEEDKLVEKSADMVIEVFSNPNKYEMKLAKQEKIDIIKPRTKNLYNNIIYTNSKDYFGRGAGGIGGGKVFWTPYTSNDETVNERRKDAFLGVDNCYIMAHEDQHGIGSNAEFDNFCETIAVNFALKYLPEDKWSKSVKYEVQIGAFNTLRLIYKEDNNKKLNRLDRKSRNKFYAIYSRNREKIEEMLKEYGYSEEDIERIRKRF